MKNFTIDANKKILGRVAAEAAAILRGKNSTDFAPNHAPDIKLTIDNVDKIKVTGKKLEQKDYKKYSGYPGGLKLTKMEEVIKKKGMKYILENAISGMLPKNRLKKIMMKNLIIK